MSKEKTDEEIVKDHLDKIFTTKITVEELKELEKQIEEYRKLYVKAVLVREKQFIEIMNEREELLELVIKLRKKTFKEEDLKNE